MRRSLSVRFATLLVVVSLAAPAMAMPRRDDSPIGPIDRFEQVMSRLMAKIHHVLDLGDVITNPK